MARNENLSLGEIVEAAERRAASGEKTHQGFDFASLAPSPLKVAKHEAQLAQLNAPGPQAPSNEWPNLTPAAKRSPAHSPAQSSGEIEDDLDSAWSRLKRSVKIEL